MHARRLLLLRFVFAAATVIFFCHIAMLIRYATPPCRYALRQLYMLRAYADISIISTYRYADVFALLI